MSQFCPSCGAPAVEGALHCNQCGASLVTGSAMPPTQPPTAQIPVVPAGPPTPPPGVPPSTPTPAGPPAPRSNTALIVAIAVLATLVVVGLIALVVSARSGGDGGDGASTTTAAPTTSTTSSTTTSTSTSTTTTTTTTTTTAPPTTTTPNGPGDVLNQPAGLFCRDLAAKGYSYSAAVDYWRFHAQPNRMDADRNGIPCETVYPRSDVIAYWGATTNPEYQDVPTGLFCKDLKARGYSYPEAVAYWFATGAPDNMDADRNGIPCETVYPASEVQDYWSG